MKSPKAINGSLTGSIASANMPTKKPARNSVRPSTAEILILIAPINIPPQSMVFTKSAKLCPIPPHSATAKNVPIPLNIPNIVLFIVSAR